MEESFREPCELFISKRCAQRCADFLQRATICTAYDTALPNEAGGNCPRQRSHSKIVEVVRRKGLTHAQVARLASSSRTRVTAIMNRNTRDISTDLLLRVLYSLGYTAKIKLQKAA